MESLECPNALANHVLSKPEFPGLGKYVVARPIAFTHANFGGKTRHQFVTKTWSFRDILAMARTGTAKQAKGFSFLTTQLTRWRSAVRARTGLPSNLLTCSRVFVPAGMRLNFLGDPPLSHFARVAGLNLARGVNL